MRNFVQNFSTAAALFLLLDSIWLGHIIYAFNAAQLADIARITNEKFEINYAAAGPVYLLMAFAITAFVLPQLDSRSSVCKAFGAGSLMGLIVYGVYDLTNLAILKNYPAAFAAADVAWGTSSFGLVTWITHRIRVRLTT